MDIVQDIVTPNSFDSINYPIKGFSDRLLDAIGIAQVKVQRSNERTGYS